MTNLKQIIGEIVYFAAWPALYFYLKSSHRTRLIIRSKDKILVVKNLIGKDEWGLPGGGLHKGENPAKGAVRELREETGLDLKSTDIKVLFQNRLIKDRGFLYYVDCFTSEIKTHDIPIPRSLDVLKARWVDQDDLMKNYNSNRLLESYSKLGSRGRFC